MLVLVGSSDLDDGVGGVGGVGDVVPFRVNNVI